MIILILVSFFVNEKIIFFLKGTLTQNFNFLIELIIELLNDCCEISFFLE